MFFLNIADADIPLHLEANGVCYILLNVFRISGEIITLNAPFSYK